MAPGTHQKTSCSSNQHQEIITTFPMSLPYFHADNLQHFIHTYAINSRTYTKCPFEAVSPLRLSLPPDSTITHPQ